MKTPMQELIDEMTHMLTEGEQSIYADVKILLLREQARKLLEKEREVIVRSFMNVSDDKDTRLEDVHLREFAEQYYNETFKTKER